MAYISETYNHKVNGQIISPNSNVFKVLNLIQRQETLTANKFMRVNQGAEKKVATAQQVKDAKIDSLKKDYKHGE